MNLAIDAGNTSVKLATFEADALVEVWEGLTEDAAVAWCQTLRPAGILLSSVGPPVPALREAIRAASDHAHVLTPTTPVPLVNHYETPETLGTDRLAAVVGAKALCPDDDCLVIDLGTGITYDFIDQTSNYFGGGISPGLRMRLRAMHSFTSRLPLLEPPAGADEVGLIGRTTRQAMLSGAVNGTAAELNGLVDAYARQASRLRVLVCGGDAAFFETRLKGSIFVVPNLVLIGLNRILQHNFSHPCS